MTPKQISSDEYNYIHSWLRVKYGKAYKCENPLCEKRSPYFQWALRSGFKYELKEDNFVQLCSRCHREYDKKEKPTEMTVLFNEEVNKALKDVSFVDRFYVRKIYK